VYAAYYSRFAAQWAYLSGVYNQIMQSQVQTCLETNGAEQQRSRLAMWKAAFIEDAESLHLARKPIFAGVISSMFADPAVCQCYDRYAPGGQEARRALSTAVESVLAREESIARRRLFLQW
jgi:hypothetical protein